MLVLGHQGLHSSRSWWSRKEVVRRNCNVWCTYPLGTCPSDMLVSIANLFSDKIRTSSLGSTYLQCPIFRISKLLDVGLKEFCCICLCWFVFVMFIGHIRPQNFRPVECCVLPNSHTTFHTQLTYTLKVYMPNCIKYSSNMKYYNYVFLFYYLIHKCILNSKCHSVESNKHWTSLPYVFLS